MAESQFLGEVSASELINGTDLCTAIGLSGYSGANNNEPWLKFYDAVDNKTKFIAKKGYGAFAKIASLREAGLKEGVSITVGNKTYKVRLISGSTVDPYVHDSGYDRPHTHGSEWNRLMYHICGEGDSSLFASEPGAPGDWANYSLSDLGITGGANDFSVCTVCTEARLDNPEQALLYGFNIGYTLGGGISVSTSGSDAPPSTHMFMFRPLLELDGFVHEEPETPFKGEVPASELISGDELATRLNFSGGTSDNSDAGWLMFVDPEDGLTKLIAKMPIRFGVSYTQLNAAGLVSGDKTIEIKGQVYKVRLVSGTSGYASGVANVSDPTITQGCEWNRLLYHICTEYAGGGTEGLNQRWAEYSGDEIGVNPYSWCQELGITNGNIGGAVVRGYHNITNMSVVGLDNNGSSVGWRPVLEYVGPYEELETPFKGELSASELISGAALADKIGLNVGTSINSSSPWLEFVDPIDGKLKYIAKRPFRSNITWSELQAAGARGTEIVIKGNLYNLRMPYGGQSRIQEGVAGLDHVNTHGSEWNRLMYHVATGLETDIFNSEPGAPGDWAQYSPEDLGSKIVHCQELVYNMDREGEEKRVVTMRGSSDGSLTQYRTVAADGRSEHYVWVPVLEWISEYEEEPLPDDDYPEYEKAIRATGTAISSGQSSSTYAVSYIYDGALHTLPNTNDGAYRFWMSPNTTLANSFCGVRLSKLTDVGTVMVYLRQWAGDLEIRSYTGSNPSNKNTTTLLRTIQLSDYDDYGNLIDVDKWIAFDIDPEELVQGIIFASNAAGTGQLSMYEVAIIEGRGVVPMHPFTQEFYGWKRFEFGHQNWELEPPANAMEMVVFQKSQSNRRQARRSARYNNSQYTYYRYSESFTTNAALFAGHFEVQSVNFVRNLIRVGVNYGQTNIHLQQTPLNNFQLTSSSDFISLEGSFKPMYKMFGTAYSEQVRSTYLTNSTGTYPAYPAYPDYPEGAAQEGQTVLYFRMVNDRPTEILVRQVAHATQIKQVHDDYRTSQLPQANLLVDEDHAVTHTTQMPQANLLVDEDHAVTHTSQTSQAILTKDYPYADTYTSQVLQSVLAIDDADPNIRVSTFYANVVYFYDTDTTNITQVVRADLMSQGKSDIAISQVPRALLKVQYFSDQWFTQIPQALLVKEDESIFFMVFRALQNPNMDELYMSNTQRAFVTGGVDYIQLEGDIPPGSYLIRNGEPVGLTTPVAEGDYISICSGVVNWFTTAINIYSYGRREGQTIREVVGLWPVILPELSPVRGRDFSTIATNDYMWLSDFDLAQSSNVVMSADRTAQPTFYGKDRDAQVYKYSTFVNSLEPDFTAPKQFILEMDAIHQKVRSDILEMEVDHQKANSEIQERSALRHSVLSKTHHVSYLAAHDHSQYALYEYIKPTYSFDFVSISFIDAHDKALVSKFEDAETNYDSIHVIEATNYLMGNTHVLLENAEFDFVQIKPVYVGSDFTRNHAHPEVVYTSFANVEGANSTDVGYEYIERRAKTTVQSTSLERNFVNSGFVGYTFFPEGKETVLVGNSYFRQQDKITLTKVEYETYSVDLNLSLVIDVDFMHYSQDSIVLGTQYDKYSTVNIMVDEHFFHYAPESVPVMAHFDKQVLGMVGVKMDYLPFGNNSPIVKQCGFKTSYTPTLISQEFTLTHVGYSFANLYAEAPTGKANYFYSAGRYGGYDTVQELRAYTEYFYGVNELSAFGGYRYTTDVDLSFTCELFSNGPVKWLLQGG